MATETAPAAMPKSRLQPAPYLPIPDLARTPEKTPIAATKRDKSTPFALTLSRTQLTKNIS
jgi:hypothetical protein